MFRFNRSITIALLGLLVLLAPTLRAQVSSSEGAIQGAVQDGSGSIVVGA